MQALDFNGDDLTDTVQQKLIVLPTGFTSPSVSVNLNVEHFFTSVIFTAPVSGQPTICAMTLIANKDKLPRYLTIHSKAQDC